MKEQEFIIANTAKCWIEDFKSFVGDASFPVAEDDFMPQINRWVETTQTGKGHKAMQNIGIVDDRVVYTQIEARTTVRFD